MDQTKTMTNTYKLQPNKQLIEKDKPQLDLDKLVVEQGDFDD